MKVFNLTDVSTPQLAASKLVNHTFAVGAALLSPGDSGDVPPELVAQLRPEIQKLVTLGAVAVDTPPPAYVTAKQKKLATPAPTLPATAPDVAGRRKSGS